MSHNMYNNKRYGSAKKKRNAIGALNKNFNRKAQEEG